MDYGYLCFFYARIKNSINQIFIHSITNRYSDSNLYWIHWNDLLHPLEWDGEAGGQKVNGWTLCQLQSGRSIVVIDVRWGRGEGADGKQDETLFSAACHVDQIHPIHPIHSPLPKSHMMCAGKSPQRRYRSHTRLLQQPRPDPARHSRPWFISIIFFCEFVAFHAFLILSHKEGSWSAMENDRILWQHELVFYLVLERWMSEISSDQ